MLTRTGTEVRAEGRLMRRILLVALLGAAAALGAVACGDDDTSNGGQADRGTAEEAVAMVNSALAAYDEQGTEVFTLITEPSTEFVDRDLYVFVYGPDGRIVAHGLDAGLIGREASTIVDIHGREFALEFMERATPDGVWVDYAWTDPLTGEEVEKTSWVVRHDGYVFGTGVYKPE
jgi:cytochrome c